MFVVCMRILVAVYTCICMVSCGLDDVLMFIFIDILLPRYKFYSYHSDMTCIVGFPTSPAVHK